MEEEIDLHKYVVILLRYWYWIVGLTMLAAVVAFVYTSLQPPSYRASSVVLVKQDPYNIQFDARFRTAQESASAYKAFPTLATSDGVLLGVVDAFGSLPENNGNTPSLRSLARMLSAGSNDDPRLIVLTAENGSGPVAIMLANLWADEFVQHTNDIYGQGEQDIAFFKGQLEQAERALNKAEAALIEFEAQNEGTIIAGQLDSLNLTQKDYLAAQRNIAYILQDIKALQAQMAELPDSQAASFTDSLTALFLQIRAFDAEALVPIQLQVDGSQAFDDKSQAEQIAILNGLADTLQAKSTEVDARLTELEPQILTLQQKLQESRVQRDRLANAEEIASETYLTLARKVEEARIAAQEEEGVLQVGSYASVPVGPIKTQRLLYTVGAAMLGLMIGAFAAFAIESWRQERPINEDGTA